VSKLVMSDQYKVYEQSKEALKEEGVGKDKEEQKVQQKETD